MSQKVTTFPTVSISEVPASTLATEAEPYRHVVLVVDDETVVADTLTEILKRSGYAAVSEYDAESALETALVMPPEMVITDVVLPGMNGIELAVTLRRMFPDCRVILSSGHAHVKRQLAPAEYAGEEFVFLAKPVHPKVLLERVSQAFRQNEQQGGAQCVVESAQSA
jgi:DNA-binding NtrC family response regulator